jgi:proline iminopeptidase
VREQFAVETDAGIISGSVGGDGRDLLLIHGGPGLSDYMGILDDELTGWRTIRYQQRGIAPSAIDGPFDVEQHVADALAVLDELNVEHVVVLGHSWGGHLALQVALADPERVQAVLVVDGLGSTGYGGAPELGAELRRRLPDNAVAILDDIDLRLSEPDATDDDALQSILLLWPSYFADPSDWLPLPLDTRVSLSCSVGTFGSAAAGISDGSFAERLRRLAAPVVVLVGEKSPLPNTAGEETAALAPSGEFTVIPGAGHLPWYEQPGCVAKALTRVTTLLNLE